MQTAWHRFLGQEPSLEALESVYAISQANLTHIKDAIQKKREIISGPPHCTIDPYLLQSDGTSPFISPFTTIENPEIRTINDSNSVCNYHVPTLGSASFGVGNARPMPPVHDQSFPPWSATGGHVSTLSSDKSDGRAQDIGFASSGTKRKLWSDDNEGEPPIKQRVADPGSISHSSPRVSDLTEHELEVASSNPCFWYCAYC